MRLSFSTSCKTHNCHTHTVSEQGWPYLFSSLNIAISTLKLLDTHVAASIFVFSYRTAIPLVNYGLTHITLLLMMMIHNSP